MAVDLEQNKTGIMKAYSSPVLIMKLYFQTEEVVAFTAASRMPLSGGHILSKTNLPILQTGVYGTNCHSWAHYLTNERV